MKILNIPFISKPKAKTFTKWIAKYVFNEKWEIIDEWCEILYGTEIRWKTNYWNKFDKKVIEFRKVLMKDDSKSFLLSKKEIDILNIHFFKNLKTVLNHDKYITWSNPAWSDYDFKRTPYIIFWWKYNQFMFINFFKKLRNKDKNYSRNNNFPEINLEEYFKIFPKINKDFNDFNKIIFTALESEEINNETFEIDNSDVWKEIVDLIISPNYKLDLNDEKEKNELRVSKLRRIFKNRLRKIKPTDHLFWELPESMCEAAHIYPVSQIKKLDLKNWYMIADENNWINLPKQIHDLYDDFKIYFDLNWEIHFTNEEYKKYLKIMFNNNWNYKIIKNVLNEKRKNYIYKYNREVLRIS